MIPCPEKSVNWNTTDNLYIEGDNLDALKLLKKTYAGKIKLIYIDPPYNTGSDFIYDDDFAISKQNYDSGETSDEGCLVSNTESNGRFHSDWCSMIYPRLLLAKDLLRSDGAIFISIDDNEVDNLKKICNEIFGNDAFLTMIAIKMSEPSGLKMSHAKTRIPKLKEYILCYRKADLTLNPPKVKKDFWDDEYKTLMMDISDSELLELENIVNNESRSQEDVDYCNKLLKRASYVSLASYFKAKGIRDEHEQNKFKFENSNRIFQAVSMGAGTVERIIDLRNKFSDQIFFAYETPEKKLYLIKGDFDSSNKKPRMQVLFAKDFLSYNPCDFWQDIKTTGLDNEGYVPFKNGKKPLKAIQRIIGMVATNDGDIVLDFFSGSGTTGEAVLRQSIDDGIQRQYILIQIPENLDEQLSRTSGVEKRTIQQAITLLNSKKREHTICDLAEMRLELSNNELEGNLSKSEKGFRVLRMDSSNFKDTHEAPNEVDQSSLLNMVDNLKEERTPEDILFQILPAFQIPYSVHIEKMNLHGKKIFDVNYGQMLACFDMDVTDDVIEEMARRKPSYVVMRDLSFKNDSSAANYEELFKIYSPNTIRQVI